MPSKQFRLATVASLEENLKVQMLLFCMWVTLAYFGEL